MKNKKETILQQFTQYQKLNEEEKKEFWEKDKELMDNLSESERKEYQKAIWENMDEIKQRVLAIQAKLKQSV
jgi:DNA-binding FadR family transcriptional regulator